MSDRPVDDTELELLHAEVARLQISVMTLVFAVVGGTGLFVATIWLLIRGGETVGPHLGLLGEYFPGYRVSWIGSLLGFVYGALSGGVVGWVVAGLYNRVAARRQAANRR